MVGIALRQLYRRAVPPMTGRYYLVFVLPVAALVVRNSDGPPGSGISDRLGALDDRRRAAGICVSLAATLTIAQIVLPGSAVQVVNATPVIATTAVLTPIFWLVACAAIIVSYARRPASCGSTDTVTTSGPREDISVAAS